MTDFFGDVVRWAVQGSVMSMTGYWTLRAFGLVPW